MASRVYVTDEEVTRHFNRVEVADALFDNSKHLDHDLWCYICGEFSYAKELKKIWHKFSMGDGETSFNVCSHCGSWDSVQDVGE